MGKGTVPVNEGNTEGGNTPLVRISWYTMAVLVPQDLVNELEAALGTHEAAMRAFCDAEERLKLAGKRLKRADKDKSLATKKIEAYLFNNPQHRLNRR